jgi:hypothetical protein
MRKEGAASMGLFQGRRAGNHDNNVGEVLRRVVSNQTSSISGRRRGVVRRRGRPDSRMQNPGAVALGRTNFVD